MLDQKIVKVEPTDLMISLTWMLGARCNYDCMYCPAELHDTTSKHADLEKLKLAWENFYNKTLSTGLPYKIGFSGGEVTANKSFLPFVEYLRNGNFGVDQIVVTTNGSASLNYYKKLAGLVTAISFSTHSEFIDEQKFFTNVREINRIMIRPEKSVHVNIMDEYWNQDRIALYSKWLTEHDISFSINEISYDIGVRNTPTLKGVYNLEQL